VFAQLLEELPRTEFARLVQETNAERHSQGFSSWDQCIAMRCCQLAQAHSLRELRDGLVVTGAPLPRRMFLCYNTRNHCQGDHPMTVTTDHAVLRELAREYAEIAADPIQEEKRRLWSAHNSLKKTRIPVLATYGMWNVWCREVFGEDTLHCADPFYRGHERALRMMIFNHRVVGDDFILEPWITQGAAVSGAWGRMWGVDEASHSSGMEGGAVKYDPPIVAWSDMATMRPVRHAVDEAATRISVERLHDAVGDLLPIDVSRTPAFNGFTADISTDICKLRGLEQIMVDMYDDPDHLHQLLAFMRDGILAEQARAEAMGHYSLTSGGNQCLCYCDELEWPRANSGPRKRKDLWGFMAAQEFTLISPEMHDEFLLRYQLPIVSQFGLSHYGCCENLTRKIDMLRQIPNLRIIAVTPTADVTACAAQIGTDYVISWRPNPADVICCGFDEAKVRRIIREGLEATRGCHVHVHLKDIETVEGDITRLTRFVQIVREEAEAFA